MYKYFLTGLILLLTIIEGKSQNSAEQDYRQGKEMYESGRYDFAMEILKPLTLPSNKSTFSPYAGYYYSLSAIENGYSFLAEEMLKQIIVQYPDWDKLDLIRLWLAKVYFNEENYADGLATINDIKDPGIKQKSDELIQSELSHVEHVDSLTNLYYLYPYIDGLAITLADKISSQPLMKQDRALLLEIIEKFNLDKERYNFIEQFDSVKKDVYNVAVLFPFMLEDINPNNLRRSNQFILDIYDGIKIGINSLREKGIVVNLYAFDTKKDAFTTQELIESGELDGMDLLIGPLYPETVKLVSDFSLKKRINMFNPLSSNSDLIENNPFCFLLKPTYENMAYAAADFIKKNHRNKNAMIFYEDDPRDSLMAFTYKASIEEDSFTVVLTQKITGLDTISVYNTMTQKFRFDELDLSEEDSLRMVERYDLYDYFERLSRVSSYDELRKIRPLELFVIPPDSIGHIFVATNKEVIAASSISGMETRGDSITLIGYEDWLDYKSLSLNQMELLDVKFIAPGYISNTNPHLQDVYQKILHTINTSPNKYHYLGYELINFVGEMLHQHGIYFQVGLYDQEVYPGILYQGFDYSKSNDNQLIPIIEFEDSHFLISNQ
jgi:hypothetical protein